MRKTVEIQARKPFSPSLALEDIVDGLSRVQLWSAFAWDEIQNRYRRSRLGLIWIVLSYLAFVGGIAIFFGGFSDLDSMRFIHYVAVNYAIFTFLVASLTDGCVVFKSSANWIKNSSLPQSIYVYKSVARSAFTFVVSMITALFVLFFTGHEFTQINLLAIPAFLLILLNAIWMQTILGYIACRIRDMEHLVSAISRILFFVTPIIWVRSEAGGIQKKISDLNPFTHALEIFSAPLLGYPPAPNSVWAMVAITVAGFLAVLLVGGYANKRLVFWL